MSATRLQFEEQLENLRQRLLVMGSESDNMVSRAMRALTEQDIEIARTVVKGDDVVDRLDIEIETECMRLIALQQPVARDLRLIGTALKVITDLERIADYAVDIAKIGRRLARNGFYKPLVDLPRLSELVRVMLREAMTSFVNHDLELMRKVVSDDDAVDDLFHRQRDDLYRMMQQDTSIIYLAGNLLFVGKYLERIADHSVNIAERVYYIETGQLAQLALSHKDSS